MGNTSCKLSTSYSYWCLHLTVTIRIATAYNRNYFVCHRVCDGSFSPQKIFPQLLQVIWYLACILDQHYC